MKRVLRILGALLLLAATGIGIYLWRRPAAPAPDTSSGVAQTTRARTGDLLVAAAGAGTVVPADEIEVAFPSNSVVLELAVQVGDRVSEGDVLARVDDLAARLAVASAEQQLIKAQLDLETAQSQHEELLSGGAEAERLTAVAAVAAAEEALSELKAGPDAAEAADAEAALAAARESYQRLVEGPTPAELESAQLDLDRAKNSLWSAQMSRDARGSAQDIASGNYDQAQASVLNAEIAVRQAEMALENLQAPATEVELQRAQADVAKAEAALNALRAGPSAAEIAAAEAGLAQAKAQLAEIASRGSPEDIAASAQGVRQAELALLQAQLNLEAAQQDLQHTTLTAPISGTVMEISARPGETVGGNAAVTLGDLSRPLIEVFVDQTDMDKVAVGYEAEVILDALPDEVFSGRVVQMDPRVTSSGGMDLIRMLVALDAESFAKPQGLLAGLSASVDVIGGRAEGAVLVPVEALREIGPGEYAVFVVEDGTPKLRPVEVGLMDYTYAEIRSGLQANEQVSTGLVETVQ